MNWMEIGRLLLLAGIVLLALGALFMMADKLPLGRLPGDVRLGSGKFSIYIPIATCVLLSVILTLVVNFFSRGR
jgi:uncharacterized membrane protein HdeD (DUF308 family)